MSHSIEGHPHGIRRTACYTSSPDYLFETFVVALDSLLCSPKKALPGAILPVGRVGHQGAFIPLVDSPFPVAEMPRISAFWGELSVNAFPAKLPRLFPHE